MSVLKRTARAIAFSCRVLAAKSWSRGNRWMRRHQQRGRCCCSHYLGCIDTGKPLVGYDRVLEQRRAVALARHFREAEGLSIAQIAERLGRSPATGQCLLLRPV
jgi:hypothetical protein